MLSGKHKKRKIDESLVQPTVYSQQYIYKMITNTIIVQQTGIEIAQQLIKTNFERALLFSFWHTYRPGKFISFKNITNISRISFQRFFLTPTEFKKFQTVILTFQHITFTELSYILKKI